MDQNVSVCRVVHYWPAGEMNTEPIAAIVTKVHSPTCVNLTLFAENTGFAPPTPHPTSVCQRDEANRAGVWDWPARV